VHERRLVRPVLEQQPRRPAGGAMQQFGVVRAEPRVQRQVVGALQHVDRIDLEETQATRDGGHVLTTDVRGPGTREPLRGKRDAPGLQRREASAHNTSSMSLLRTAYMAASMRDFICSFSKMLRMWFLTVFSLMNNSPAMSRLLL